MDFQENALKKFQFQNKFHDEWFLFHKYDKLENVVMILIWAKKKERVNRCERMEFYAC